MSFKTVSRARPCTICLKLDWCSHDDETGASICRRVPGGIHKTDQTGCEYWLYLNEEHKPKSENKKLSSSYKPQINYNERHEVYSFLLDNLQLSGRHFHNLTQVRGLSENVVELNRYRSLRGNQYSVVGMKLLENFGLHKCFRIPGIIINDDGQCEISIREGLLIPVRDIKGRIVGIRVRVEPKQYLWLSSAKSGGAGSGSNLHFPLANYSNPDVLRFTEGELKADVVTCHTGIPTISLPGVTSWRLAIPLIQNLRPKLIKIAFDSDLHEKRTVASSLVGFCDYLEKTKFNFEVEVWND